MPRKTKSKQIKWISGKEKENYRNGGIGQSGISKSLYKKYSSIKGRLSSRVFFHQRLSSIKGSFSLRWKTIIWRYQMDSKLFQYHGLLSKPHQKLSVTGNKADRQKKPLIGVQRVEPPFGLGSKLERVSSPKNRNKNICVLK